MPNRLNLAQQRFGRLVAIQDVGAARNGSRLWLCLCDCGNKYKVRASSLVFLNHTRSCGCIRGRKAGEAAFNCLYSKMKYNASKRFLIWELEKEDVRNLTKKNCFYCNSGPNQILRSRVGRGNYVYNGIDRVDNKFGYIKGNCVPCCGQCNQSKSDLSLSEFKKWIIHLYTKTILRG